MNRDDIQQRIAGFPRWHYRFDLGNGVTTPIAEQRHLNRHEQRRDYFIKPLIDHFGGSLSGLRVLDLGCNAGFWSLAAIDAGCDYVLGIDGRSMHIEQAELVFEVKNVASERYGFGCANLFDQDFSLLGSFDVVLCLGLLYHISKPMDLLERISSVNTDFLIIDTTLVGFPGSLLHIKGEELDDPRSGVDYSVVMYPTRQAVLDMVRAFGYSARTLKPAFSSYVGARDYRFGMRRAFACAKTSDLGDFGSDEGNSFLQQATAPLRYALYLASKAVGGGRV